MSTDEFRRRYLAALEKNDWYEIMELAGLTETGDELERIASEILDTVATPEQLAGMDAFTLLTMQAVQRQQALRTPLN